MSKIQTELCKATGIDPKRGQSRQDFIAVLMAGVAELADKAWGDLSTPAQDWFNDAADAKNAKAKVLPDFPDAEKVEEAEAPTRRRGASKESKEERLTKVGDIATVKTKRGAETTGKVVELDDEMIVLDCDGEEKEFGMDRVESVTVNHGDGGSDEPDAPEPVKVGTAVEVTTKRGKVYSGKVVELDDEFIVLDCDGKEEELLRDRVETVKIMGGRGAGKAEDKDEPEKPSTRRRGATQEEEETTKPKRSSNPAGVSVGGRIRELMANDLEATQEEIGKALKKEGIEFRDTSLNMIFKDNKAFLGYLKAAKKLK